MKITSLFLIAIGLMAATTTSPSIAASRGIRTDNPGHSCDLGPSLSSNNTWTSVTPDPYANGDGNSDGTQNPSTFFSPGTVVTAPAIFCEPPAALQGALENTIFDPNSSFYDGGATPNSASIEYPGITATAGIMYEWINTNPTGMNTQANVPDAEVMVWTLPPDTSLSALAVGGYEVEFDNWCNTNDYAQSNSNTGMPLGIAVPPTATPLFTWYGNKFVYTDACGINGTNFTNASDLLFNSSGTLVGYVKDDNTVVFAASAPGWQLIATPSGLVATAASGGVTLAWTATAGAGTYNVYQSSTKGGEGSTPVRPGIVANTATITGLTSGQAYYFTVAAVYNSSAQPSGFVSSQSAEVSATVLAAVPTGLTATAGNGTVTVSWSASAGATSYSVYQGTSAGGEGNAAVASSAATTTTISPLTNGQTYYFKVSAIDAGGTSAKSNEVSATPTAPPAPPAPASSGGGAFGLIELLVGIVFTFRGARRHLLRAGCLKEMA
jgi:hypothetical protein